MASATLQGGGNLARPRANIRVDLRVIADLIADNARVLDIGCGDGALLDYLQHFKQVDARGIEISQAGVNACVAQGLSVIQGDAETDLRHYPSAAFDYVILSQTLQETRYPLAVLRGMLRVGKRAIVAFPNFGHYSVRLAWLVSGRAPRTDRFPYDWYDSPNIHFLSVLDFEALAEKQGWQVERRICVAGERQVTWLTNLMAEIAVFEVSAGAGLKPGA